MRKRTKRKLKVYAVDLAMVFLAFQARAVLKHGGSEIVVASQNEISMEEIIENEFEEESYTSIVKSRDWCSCDAEILMQIAMAEAEGEGVEGKAYVMAVVLNRVWSDSFPNTIEEVVFQNNGKLYQFTPVEANGRYWRVKPDAECYEAYQMILHGWDESEGALYFCRVGSSKWMKENLDYLYTIGNHEFFK